MRTTTGIVSILLLAGALLTACGGSSGLAWEDFDRNYTSIPERDGYVWESGPAPQAARAFAGDIDGLLDGEGLAAIYSFGTGGISDNAVIESAVLRVYQENVVGAPYVTLGNLVVDHVNIGTELEAADYDGGNITPNIGTLSSTPVLGWMTLDVTAAVQNDVSAGRPYSEFRMRFEVDSDVDGSTDDIMANDGEDTEGSGRIPQLVVSYRAPRL